MSNISRHQAGTQIAGQKTGGQFKAAERNEADGLALTKSADTIQPPDPRDPVSVHELNQAVDFTNRDRAIRKIWEKEPRSREAEKLSYELVRDTLAWRFPDAEYALLAEFDGEGLTLGELRDSSDKVIAFDAQVGGFEDTRDDYRDASMIDVADPEFLDLLWAHTDGFPEPGNGTTEGDSLTRHPGDSYFPIYRMPLRNQNGGGDK